MAAHTTRASNTDWPAVQQLLHDAVAPAARGQHVGQQLVDAAIELATSLRIPAVYVLTTTAESYFPRFGFTRTTREQVPPGVRQSAEFRFACCASAVVMRKDLGKL